MVCFDGADREGGDSAWSLSPIFIARYVVGSPKQAAAGQNRGQSALLPNCQGNRRE